MQLRSKKTLPSPTSMSTLLAFGLSLSACSSQTPEPAPAAAVISEAGKMRIPADSPLRKELVVQAVNIRQAPHELIVPAVVEIDPARNVAILPPLTGRVVDLKVGLGDRVTRGQPLMVIASGDSAQAYTDVAKSRDALDLARKQLDRAREVKDAGGAATKDLEAAQSAYAQAQAEFDRASSRLSSLGGAVGKDSARTMTVNAPLSGSVTTLAVAPGQFVNDATAVAMTLSNLDPIWVTANVPENELGKIAKGQAADAVLSAYPGEVRHGTVQFVDDVLASDTRRGKVRIAFANADGKLKPNMYGTVTLDVPQPEQILVPQSALLMNNDSTTVFVETAPWTFERRVVTLGYDEGGSASILAGLKAGERIVVEGGVLIND